MHIAQNNTINWIHNSKNISDSTNFNTSSDGRYLIIRNVTEGTIGDYGCRIVLNDETYIEGMSYNVTPFGKCMNV